MTTSPYGTWPSPLSAGFISEQVRLGEVLWDSSLDQLVWTESRNGKNIMMTAGGTSDAPRTVSSLHGAKARVGYGGGDFTVHDGVVYFISDVNSTLSSVPIRGGKVRPLTPNQGSCAAPSVSPDGRWVVFVHHGADQSDRLAIVDSKGTFWPQTLNSGQDFYMQPRFSPDGKYVAWVAWNHPNMPWDGTQLYLAEVVYRDEGLPSLGTIKAIAGGNEIAIFQGEFSPDGRSVYYISDETGWGQLWAYDILSGKSRRITFSESEQGEPAWGQEMRTYALCPKGEDAYIIDNQAGSSRLNRVSLSTGKLTPLTELSSYTAATFVAISPLNGKIALRASAPKVSSRILSYDPVTASTRILARSTSEEIPEEALAQPETLSWRSAAETIHGIYYPPHHPKLQSPGKPPLIVLIHGGPTAQTRLAWSHEAQFLATRGYAVLQVNYRGSTGYGRDYMLKLRGQWGVADVEDAVSGAQYLANLGRVNPKQMVIMGGSAGGYTVLRALTEAPDVFAAGVSLYGLSSLFVVETHKFEARYNDSLVGVLPQDAALFRARSPLFAAERIKCPVLVFQGAKDDIVPKEHADLIVEALKLNKVPHVYHVYENEGHGWQKRETLAHYYAALERFLLEHVIYT